MFAVNGRQQGFGLQADLLEEVAHKCYLDEGNGGAGCLLALEITEQQLVSFSRPPAKADSLQ